MALAIVVLLAAAAVHYVLVTRERPRRELWAFLNWSLAGAVALPLIVFSRHGDAMAALLSAPLGPVVYGVVRLCIHLRFYDAHSTGEQQAREMERLRIHPTDFGGAQPPPVRTRKIQPAALSLQQGQAALLVGRRAAMSARLGRPRGDQRSRHAAAMVGAIVLSTIGLTVVGANAFLSQDHHGGDVERVASTLEDQGLSMVRVTPAARDHCQGYRVREYTWSAPGARGRACVRQGQVLLQVDEAWPRQVGTAVATSAAERTRFRP